MVQISKNRSGSLKHDHHTDLCTYMKKTCAYKQAVTVLQTRVVGRLKRLNSICKQKYRFNFPIRY